MGWRLCRSAVPPCAIVRIGSLSHFALAHVDRSRGRLGSSRADAAGLSLGLDVPLPPRSLLSPTYRTDPPLSRGRVESAGRARQDGGRHGSGCHRAADAIIAMNCAIQSNRSGRTPFPTWTACSLRRNGHRDLIPGRLKTENHAARRTNDLTNPPSCSRQTIWSRSTLSSSGGGSLHDGGRNLRALCARWSL